MKKLLICIMLIITSCSSFPSETHTFSDSLNHNSEYLFVLGDIQEYVANDLFMPYYKHTISWVNSQLNNHDVAAVLFTGDITASNLVDQWQRFKNVISDISDKVPIISCIGNHDYDWNQYNQIVSREATLFSTYTSFPITTKHIVACYESNSLENIIVEIEINERLFNIVVLEYSPRDVVVDWAEKYIIQNKEKGINFILLTHEFLTSEGERISSSSSACFNSNEIVCSPNQIWEQLVYPYNFVCVLCGHNGFNQILYSNNSAGKLIPQILFNLQYLKNGGNGYIEVWEFPMSKKTVYMRIYDTINERFITENIKLFSYD